MRLAPLTLCWLLAGCNALTGASDLEMVECTSDCPDASSRDATADTADSAATDSGEADTATETDTGASDAAPDATDPCSNGVKDMGEADVDCGGACTTKCANGKACSAGTDCASTHCIANVCAACPTGMLAVSTPGGGKYCVDTLEVTNEEYQAFLAAGVATGTQPAYCAWNSTFTPQTVFGIWPPTAARLKHPVRNVDWCDALAYCTWKGRRLCGKIGGGTVSTLEAVSPDSSEWMRACTNGGTTTYPYGAVRNDKACNGQGNGVGNTVQVGSMALCLTTVGHKDLSGNVAEWEDGCAGSTGASDTCRARGGSFGTGDPRCNQADGAPRSERSPQIGFRCCAN